jgi:hypothetical protein
LRETNRNSHAKTAKDAKTFSKSKAERLFRKWNPSLERVEQVGTRAPSPPVNDHGAELDREPPTPGTQAPVAPAFEHPDDEETDREARERYDFDPDEPFEEELPVSSPFAASAAATATLPPFAAALARRAIHDLERDYDQNDHEIFVESREEHSGKPKVWYQRSPRTGNYSRYDRDSFGVIGTTLGPSPLLPPDREIRMTTAGRSPP